LKDLIEVCILLEPADIKLAKMSRDYNQPVTWSQQERIIIALLDMGVIE
jgi:hypothetical protein